MCREIVTNYIIGTERQEGTQHVPGAGRGAEVCVQRRQLDSFPPRWFWFGGKLIQLAILAASQVLFAHRSCNYKRVMGSIESSLSSLIITHALSLLLPLLPSLSHPSQRGSRTRFPGSLPCWQHVQVEVLHRRCELQWKNLAALGRSSENATRSVGSQERASRK